MLKPKSIGILALFPPILGHFCGQPGGRHCTTPGPGFREPLPHLRSLCWLWGCSPSPPVRHFITSGSGAGRPLSLGGGALCRPICGHPCRWVIVREVGARCTCQPLPLRREVQALAPLRPPPLGSVAPVRSRCLVGRLRFWIRRTRPCRITCGQPHRSRIPGSRQPARSCSIAPVAIGGCELGAGSLPCGSHRGWTAAPSNPVHCGDRAVPALLVFRP
jgi:hypothetical protein